MSYLLFYGRPYFWGDKSKMKKSFYCVRCNLEYKDDRPNEDELVCDECGGQLAELPKDTDFDEGGEG